MRKIAGLTLAAIFGALMLLSAPAAQASEPTATAPLPATHYNGVCEEGELCLFYNSGCNGSMADFYYPVENFQGYVFRTPGAGQGQSVKNNAAAARNTDNYVTARIYYNSGWQGPYDNVGPNTSCRNLINTYNENASFEWI